jgi:hypothetical protein
MKNLLVQRDFLRSDFGPKFFSKVVETNLEASTHQKTD